jgi:hypothetical protein
MVDKIGSESIAPRLVREQVFMGFRGQGGGNKSCRSLVEGWKGSARQLKP